MVTGEKAPKDDRAGEVPNLRLKALEEIRSYAKQQVTSIGLPVLVIEIPQGTVSDIMSLNGWVNAPDTWTSKVADDENDAMKTAMGNVVNSCTNVFSVIDSEMGSIHANDLDMVPEDHPDDKWTL